MSLLLEFWVVIFAILPNNQRRRSYHSDDMLEADKWVLSSSKGHSLADRPERGAWSVSYEPKSVFR